MMTPQTWLKTFVFVFILVGAYLTPPQAHSSDTVLACPSLATAQQLGTCPSEQDLRIAYRASCPEFMEKRGECKPFKGFAMAKNTALWSVMGGSEEFMAYVSCAKSNAEVTTSKPVSIEAKCALKSGRCEARCTYDSGVTFSLRVKGACQTATGEKITCKDDPQSCVFKCEQFTD